MQSFHDMAAAVARWSGARGSGRVWALAAVLGTAGLGCEHERSAVATAKAADHRVAAGGVTTEPRTPRSAVATAKAADHRVAAGGVTTEPEMSRSSGPLADLTPPAAGQTRLVGVVVEHLPAGGYHYLRVASERGETRWVVTMGGEFDEGMHVEVESLGVRHDFHSRRLDRRFDALMFGVVRAA